MNIIQIGTYPENADVPKGGVEASILGLVNSLILKPDCNVKVISLPKKKAYKGKKKYCPNLEIVSFNNPFNFDFISFIYIKDIMREINEFKPDICHIHGSSLLGTLIILYLKYKRINYILTIHGLLTVELKNSFRRSKKIKTLAQLFFYSILEFVLVNISYYIISDTYYVKDWINRRRLFYPEDYIFVIPQGIENFYFELQDNYEDNILISIGSISKRKGYEYSIRAVHQIVKYYPDLRYYILGFISDENYYKELKRLVKSLELEETIFIKPNLKKAELIHFLAKSNIFILHSEEESQGIVFCEAMAAGKPIIATNVGGVPYIINDSVNGFLSPYSNVDVFSSNIKRVLSDKNLRKVISLKNRIEGSKYSWESITERILKVYESNSYK